METAANLNNDDIQIDEKLIEAFHLMYDNYPEAAQLTHKSKRVMAVNPACAARGGHAGMICSQQGSEPHRGCLATQAIAEQKMRWTRMKGTGEQKVIVLWLPVPGYPDFYIHFTAGELSYYPD